MKRTIFYFILATVLHVDFTSDIINNSGNPIKSCGHS